MERIAAGEIELAWEPATRVAVMRYLVPKTGDAEDARALTAQLGQWTADLDAWGLLVDCGRITNVDAGWRNVWFEFMKANARSVHVAWFNANTVIRVVIQMFLGATRLVSPLRGRAFSTEPEARAYPREHGYDA